MNAHKIDIDTYYRKGSFDNFSKGAKCSISMTSKIDVTDLYSWSKKNGTKFYINFLYVLTKALNSREDYRMEYRWQTNELWCYDKINPCHYVFFDEKEICSPVYSEYFEDYKKFYDGIVADSANANQRRTYELDAENHPNWFDASYISWESYESLNVELPDGYLYFMPIINWGRYREETVEGSERLLMPVTVRMNHAIVDGYQVTKVFELIRKEISSLIK